MEFKNVGIDVVDVDVVRLRRLLLLAILLVMLGKLQFVNGQVLHDPELSSSSSSSSLIYYFTSTACTTENRFYGSVSGGDVVVETGSTTSSTTTGLLIRNPNTTVCAPSLGVAAAVSISPPPSSSSSSSETTTTGGTTAGNNNNNYAVRSERSFFQLLDDANIVVNDSSGDSGIGGISFEMWLKLTSDNNSDNNSNNNNNVHLQPILFIGTGGGNDVNNNNNDDDDLFFNFCDQNNLDLMFAAAAQAQTTTTTTTTTGSNNINFELFYRSSSTVFEPCQRYPISLMMPLLLLNDSNYDDSNDQQQQQQQQQLVHVVISLTDKHQQVYINGMSYPVISQPFSPMLQHFNTNSKLFLLSYPSRNNNNELLQQQQQQQWTTTTTGITMYKLALHSGIMNKDQVIQLLQQGLPHTPPYAFNYTIEMNEDAEFIPGSHYYDHPEWYLHPPLLVVKQQQQNNNDDLQQFQLKIGSVDKEVRDFQQSLNLTTSMNGTKNQRHLYVYILDDPPAGCLYRPDGAPITTTRGGCGGGGGGGTEIAGRTSSVTANDDDDEEEEEGMHVAIVDNDPATLIYVPSHNQHSFSSSTTTTAKMTTVFTSITYCVSEIPILHQSQCPSVGVIDIVVLPVNDPPMAIPVTGSLIVKEGAGIGISTPKVLLTGTDVDDDDVNYEYDYIQQVHITEPPKHGYLVLSVSTFRSDGLLHGTLLSDLNYTVPTRQSSSSFTDPVYVKYVWNSSSTTSSSSSSSPPPIVVIKGKTATDSFRFRVADRNGTWSIEEKVQVVIVSSLTATVASEQVTIQEDSTTQATMKMSLLKWYGNDTSIYQRDIGYFVETIPPLESGLLFYNNKNKSQQQEQVASGDLLKYVESFPYTKGLGMTFVPSANYCTGSSTSSSADTSSNNNNSAAGLTLRFRTVSFAPDSSQVVTSVSDVSEQKLFVSCVLDALTLTGPTSYAYPIKALSLRIASSDPCLASRLHHWSYVDDESLNNCSAFVARINGIRVTSQDIDESEMAQVAIFTCGYLTLNPVFWNRTIPLHGRRILNKGNVSFLASPNDLTNILSDLLYQNFQHGNDTVVVIVTYGNCSALLADPMHRELKELKTPECQILRHTIAVRVVVDTTKEVMPSQLVSGFPWQVVFCMLGYPAIYYGFVRLTDAIKGNAEGDDDDVTVDDHTPLWIQHLSDTGDYYYENTETGEVTWLAPVGELFVPWEDEDGEDEESKTEEM